jgi:hypothetical protein
VFVNLARTAARARGVDPLPMLVLPHPMEGRPPAEIDGIAEQRFAEVMALLVDQRMKERMQDKG